MNIYIYGNGGFKKDIHQTLEHANIKFKLDENSIIKDIVSLDELKQAIEANPNDIYLIDDEKIIKKRGLSQKIKFLAPKDGIEEEFLLDNGIADLSVDSLKEIPKYIIQKFEQQKSQENVDIQESIIDIVDDAYNENNVELDDELSLLLSNEESEKDIVDLTQEAKEEPSSLGIEDEFNLDDELELMTSDDNNEEQLSEEDISLDELEELMSFDEENDEDLSEDEIDDILNFDEEISEDKIDDILNFDEDVGLNNITHDYDDNNLIDKDFNLDSNDKVSENEDIINKIDDIGNIDDFFKDESIKGENMANDFSELDSLNEQDILSALDNIDDIQPLNLSTSTKIEKDIVKETNSVDLGSSNVDDIASLISKLLNNKTLEITIKIKD